MRSLILISAVCLLVGWTLGNPDKSQGGGAFAFSDTTGNRYGGIYNVEDGKVTGKTFGTKDGQKIDKTYGPESFDDISAPNDDFPIPFVPLTSYNDVNNFVPDYFKHINNAAPEPFFYPFPNPMFGFNGPMRNFPFGEYQPGYFPNFGFRFNAFNGLPGFPSFPSFPGFQPLPAFDNSAFASGAIGPGFSEQTAAISPENPQSPNVNVVNRFSDTSDSGRPNFYSVQTSSFSSSSNVNGKPSSQREAVTTVNDNGKVSTYRVKS